MILIGITGIVGSGKTTVSEMLRKKGMKVVDLDKLAKEVTELATVKNKVKKIFGDNYIKENKIDTEKISELVFKDKEKLKVLEDIVHPAVKKKMQNVIRSFDKEGIKTVIIDAPLLYEKGLDKEVNKVIVVSTNTLKTKERLRKRGMGDKDIERRTAIQMTIEEKEKMADFIVYNNGTLEELKKEVDGIIKWIEVWEERLYAS